MEHQHTHKTIPFSKEHFPIVILCDRLESPANVGGLFRICEAFGVAKILFYNGHIDFSSNRLKRTARATHRYVDYTICKDIKGTLREYIEKGYEVVSLEVSDKIVATEKISLNKKAIVLIIGNEKFGISQEILALTSKHMHIEMYGENSSMNVVQATGIALYTIVNKLKQKIE